MRAKVSPHLILSYLISYYLAARGKTKKTAADNALIHYTCPPVLAGRRLNEDSPALVCMQEGRVIGETSIESHNRCSRNFKKRQAVLRVAAEAAAARAAEVKHIEMPAHLYRHANTTCPKRM